MQQLIGKIILKVFKIDDMKYFYEEVGHNCDLISLFEQDATTFSYKEIAVTYYNIFKYLKNPEFIINYFTSCEENCVNFRWVRFSKEIVKLFMNNGKGSMHLDNTFDSPLKEIHNAFNLFGGTFKDIFK